MAQRIVRAKARLREAGALFERPDADDMPGRLAAAGTCCTSCSPRAHDHAGRGPHRPSWRTRPSG